MTTFLIMKMIIVDINLNILECKWLKKASPINMQMNINLNILECK